MFNRVKKLRALSRKLEAFEPYETDEKGQRVIRLHVNDSDSFLSPLSVEGVPVISDETAYLLNFYFKNMSVDSDEKLNFHISGWDFSPLEKEIYKKAVRNYYKEDFIDVQLQFKENTRNSIWMIIVGLLIMGVLIFARIGLGLHEVLVETVNIVSWVFLWGAVELLFIQRPELRKRQIQNLKILEADFSFQEKAQPEDIIPFAIQKLENSEEEREAEENENNIR